MANGYKVRDLQELQVQADLESVIRYFHNGKLRIWLESRGYYELADLIQNINPNDAAYIEELCAILHLDNQKIEGDIKKIQVHEEKYKRLRELTSDESILQEVDRVAFNQNDLDAMEIGQGETIYLCGDNGQTYRIDTHIYPVCYVGIFGEPNLDVGEYSFRDLYDKGIRFRQVTLPESCKTSLREVRTYQSSSCLGISDVSVNSIHAKTLHTIIQNCLIDFLHDPDTRVLPLKNIIEGRFKPFINKSDNSTASLKKSIEDRLDTNKLFIHLG